MELTPEEDSKPAENERRKYKEKEDKNSSSRRRRSRSRSRSKLRSRSRSRSRKNGRKRDRDSQRNDNGNSGDEVIGERFYGNYQRREQRYQRKRGYESHEEMEIGERYYGGSRGYSRRKSRSRSRERFKDYSRRDREDGRRRKDDKGTEKEFEKRDEKEDERAKDKENNENSTIPPAQKRTVDLLTSRTGGAYIPPAKLRMMQAEITDKSGEAYQRIAWEALKKSIHGYINKVNTSNIGIITRELLRENIVRGRGLLARSIIQAQAASPTFTPVYAALAAVINSKFPNIGELLLKRLVIQFKQGFRRNDKTKCISSGTFIAHLVNQKVAHEILALEILTLLVHTPTDDSVEVAIALLKECGMRLTEVCRKGMEAIFEMLRHILHEGLLDKRVQYMIEVIFQIRKDEFKDHEAIPEELDLVEEENQFTHVITLDEAVDSQGILDVFKPDSEYITNEDKYKQLIKEILDTDDSDSNDEGDDEEGDSSDEDSDAANDENKEDVIVDNTETNLTTLRRTIYLTIHSSLDFEECAHKLMKIQLKPGQEIELCHMFLDCCAENRTYEKFYGLLAGRFCAINKMYVTPFEQIFKTSYDTIHRLDTNKLRNVSKFFAHLLYTDSISWEVLSCIRLNEEETTSSSRVFIKILFQELSEYMGLSKLNQRVKDITLQSAFDGLFPRDDPKNTRFAINFFTSIGLGGLTDDLREHLKSQPKTSAVPPVIPEETKSSSSDSPSSSSSSSSSSSESESSSDSSSSTSSSSSSSSDESSEDEKRRKKKTLKKKSKKVVEKVDKKAEKSRNRKSKDDSKKKDLKNEHKKKKKTK